MSNIKGFSVILLSFFCACTVRTEPLKVIKINDTEWLQPVDFSQFSWSEVASICDVNSGGSCTGKLGTADLTKWTWASAQELALLFNHIIGRQAFDPIADNIPQKIFEKDETWATAFFDAGFRPHTTAGTDRYLSAYLRDEVAAPGLPDYRLLGAIAEYRRPYCKINCNGAEINTSWDYHNQNGPPAFGYWFCRSSRTTPR